MAVTRHSFDCPKFLDSNADPAYHPGCEDFLTRPLAQRPVACLQCLHRLVGALDTSRDDHLESAPQPKTRGR